MNEKQTISRRRLLEGAAIAGASIMVSGRGAAAAASRPKRPNFIFILADDMGAFDLSCYGRPDYHTPRIDSLARDGLKFHFGYANSSSCGPTRVGLFSGRYQNRVLVGTGEGGGFASKEIGYDPAWTSLPKVLKAQGYRTALVGKWNLGLLPKFGPNKSGYDEFFGFMGGAIDYYRHDLGKMTDGSSRTDDFYENDKPVKVEGYATDLFTDRACDFIDRNHDRPFLLSLHYNAPHWPWQTRKDRGGDRINDVHYDGGSMATYAEMVRELDEGVGRVLDMLDRHNLARDTVVVFTSDNGGERFSLDWPLKGGKGDLWEGGIRVPLLARWPGRIRPNSVTDQIALSMDWLPTFAALAGAATDPASPPDGIDLSPQLKGQAPMARTLFWKVPEGLAVLEYPWKYVETGGHEYLLNLKEDMSENANFKLKQPEIFARLKNMGAKWAATMLPSAPPARQQLKDEMPALEKPSRG